MNTLKVPQIDPEEIKPEKEKPALRLVENENNRRAGDASETKPPFYADLEFWVKVSFVLLVGLAVLYFFTMT